MSEIADILVRLDRIEARLSALEGASPAAASISIDGVPVSTGGVPEPSEDVKALLRTPGKEIHAIKLYREQTGLGLKEAKDALAPYHF